MADIDESAEAALHRQAGEDERQQRILEVARLQGEMAALRGQKRKR